MLHSISSATWQVHPAQPAASLPLTRELGLAPLAARVLLARGVTTLEAAEPFLSPRLDHLHDPFLMKDMAPAARLLAQAIAERQPILVHGDYDADGVTGTALLVRALRDLGGHADFHVPHRLRDGYGLQAEVAQRAAANGARVLVTVDCGSSDFEAVAAARAAGLSVIVTDHHQVKDHLPQADAVLNPHRRDCPYPFKDLAGVGVAFKLVCALLAEMGIDTQSHLKFLDLVTLGTMADVVPLLGENRVLVKHGLPRLAKSRKCGIAALLAASDLGERALTGRDVLFRLAPQLNAAGRMDDPRESVALLLTRDAEEARGCAQRLSALNDTRQQEDRRTFQEAEAMVRDTVDLASERAIVLASEAWHPGVVGIVASRLVERYFRPTLLIALRDGVGRGSGRSIGAFHLWEALNSCSGLLVRFGGHRHAAGFTIESGRIDALRAAFGEIARTELREEDLAPVLRLDAWADLPELGIEAVSQLNALAPFGTGNPEPVLGTTGVTIEQISTCGADGQHLRLRLRESVKSEERRVKSNAASHESPATLHSSPITPHPASAIPAIWFGQGALASQLQVGDRVDVCYQPEIDDWGGTPAVRLRLCDMKTQRPVAAAAPDPAGLADENGQCSLF